MGLRLRDRSLVTLVLIAVAVCAACGGQASPTKAGGTLVVDQNFAYDDLDPAIGSHQTAVLVDKCVYDTLLTINPNDLSKPYPSLATSYTVSPDAKVFTFNLRHGVKFSGGNPLTSADVVWSLQRLAVSGQRSGGQDYSMIGMTASAPDPYTVVLTSKVPNPAVPITMTTSNAGILDSVLVQQNGGTLDAHDKAENFLNASSAGSGPYVVTNVDRTGQIILKANPNYWGGKPVYSTVILRNAPPATQRFDIQDGQAQVALDIPSQDAASLSSSKVNVTSAPTSDQLFLVVNARASVLSVGPNQNFRDAVKYGLDYKGLVALAGSGAAQMTGFIPDGILGSLPLSEAPARDVGRATAALAQVGVAIPPLTLEFPTDRTWDGLSITPLATKIQSDLKEVGITVDLRGEPNAVLDGRWTSGETQLYLSANSADYPDAADFTGFQTIGGSDTTAGGWVAGMDPSIDVLTATALSATSSADRNAAFQALERAMNAKAYWNFLLQPGRTLVTAKSVHATVNPFDYVDLGSVS